MSSQLQINNFNNRQTKYRLLNNKKTKKQKTKNKKRVKTLFLFELNKIFMTYIYDLNLRFKYFLLYL